LYQPLDFNTTWETTAEKSQDGFQKTTGKYVGRQAMQSYSHIN
jgi:hypothetical protein